MSVTMAGASGIKHILEVYSPNASWNQVAGIYAFGYLTAAGWHIVYIGETADFSTRLNNHDRWNEAVKLGSTNVLAMVYSGGDAPRKQIERDLIASHQPVMNSQHMGLGSLLDITGLGIGRGR